MKDKIQKRIDELNKLMTERGQQLESGKKQMEAISNSLHQLQGAIMEQKLMLAELPTEIKSVKPEVEFKVKDKK